MYLFFEKVFISQLDFCTQLIRSLKVILNHCPMPIFLLALSPRKTMLQTFPKITEQFLCDKWHLIFVSNNTPACDEGQILLTLKPMSHRSKGSLSPLALVLGSVWLGSSHVCSKYSKIQWLWSLHFKNSSMLKQKYS